MDGQTPNLHIFRCVNGLRGYHVYQVDWKPILGQEIVRVNYMYLQMFSPSIALISFALISYNKVHVKVQTKQIEAKYVNSQEMKKLELFVLKQLDDLLHFPFQHI